MLIGHALLAASLVMPVPSGGSGGEDEEPSDSLAGYTSDRAADGSIERFRVPEVTCDTDQQGVVLGIGDGRALGERELLAGVTITCSDGAASTVMLALVDDEVDAVPVEAGDFLSAAVDFKPDGRVVVTTTSATTGERVRAAGSAAPFGLHVGALPTLLGGDPAPPPEFSLAVFGVEVRGRPMRRTAATCYWRYDDADLVIRASRLRLGDFTLSSRLSRAGDA